MNNSRLKVNPSKVLEQLLKTSLNAILTPLEDKFHHEMLDLQYLQESTNQLTSNLNHLIFFLIAQLQAFAISDSSKEKATKSKPKVIVIKKKSNLRTKSPISSPKPTSITRALNSAKTTKTEPQTPKSLSQDKVTISKHKSKTRNYHLIEQKLTKQPTAKSISPLPRKSFKAKTKIVHKAILHRKATDKSIAKPKLSSKTTTVSNQSTPTATPRQLIKDHVNKLKQMRKISNYFGNIINKLNDDQLLIQDKFNLTDIRLSKIEAAFPNSSSGNKFPSLMHSEISDVHVFPSNDQLETNWDLISQYFTLRELGSMIQVNKAIGSNTITRMTSLFEHDIEVLEEHITLIQKQNQSNNKLAEDHSYSNSSVQFKQTVVRALNSLNDSNSDKLFLNKEPGHNCPGDRILLVFKAYFLIIQRTVPHDELLWKDVCDYFLKRPIVGLGSFVENELFKAPLTLETMYRLDTVAYSKHSKLFQPEYFKDVCAITGLFAFIVKEVLESIGLTKETITDSKKPLRILNAKVEYKNKLLMRYNKLNERYFN